VITLAVSVPSIDLDRASRDDLIRHIDDLEMRLGEVLPQAEPVRRLRTVFGLTHQQAEIVAALSDGMIHSRTQLHAACSLWSPNTGQTIVDMQLVRVRRALGRFGIKIENVFGDGWQISTGSAARLRLVMKGGPA